MFKTDRIGDMLLFFPYMRKLHDWYSERNGKVTLVIRPELLELVRRARVADRVVVYPYYKNSLQWTLFRIGFWLRNPADIVCLNAAWFEDELMPAYWTSRKISVHMGDQPTQPGAIDISKMSIGEWNRSILSALGIEGGPACFDYKIFCDPVKTEWVEEPYILICAEASDSRRCWESEKFVELIRRLSFAYNRKIMLIGTSREHGEAILKQCSYPSKAVNLCGETTLFELFSLIHRADFLISNDTSCAHIGALTGTKTFIICGKGDYGIFVPYRPELEGKQVFSIFSAYDCRDCHWRKPKKECQEAKAYRCISEISADEVWNVVKEHASVEMSLS